MLYPSLDPISPKNPLKLFDRSLAVAVKVFGIGALLTFSVLCVSVTIVCVHLDDFVMRETNRFDTFASDVQQTSQALRMTIVGVGDNLNRPCGGGRPCGTFAQLAKTLVAASDLTKHADYLTAQEQATLNTNVQPLIAQAGEALKNVDRATADLHPLLIEATARTHALAPVEANAAESIATLDTLLQSPEIRDGIHNLDVTSQNTAETSAHVERIAAMGEKEVHDVLHPRPLDRVAQWTLRVVGAIGTFF